MTVPPANTAVSSPAATGGAGTFFEQYANAHWLALLLVKGIPPILHDCSVTELHLQTEHLGWSTDDFLVVAEDATKTRRKLAGQVKRTFTVSATDSECKKAISDFWMDLTRNKEFSAQTDRFALVVLRGTNTLLEHFAGLLELARSVSDGAEFARRLTLPRFVCAKTREYCTSISSIVAESEGRAISAAEVWPLLRVLHVLSFDLTTPTSQTEAHIKSLLAHTSHGPCGRADAEDTWIALLKEAGDGMPVARSFTRETLPKTLRERHSLIGGAEKSTLQRLVEHSAPILAGIRSTVGSNLHLPRGELVQKLLDAVLTSRVVLVSGAAGSGKSAVAKDALGIMGEHEFAFCFRAEEFATAHFDETLHKAQIPANAAALSAIMAGQATKVLLIESVERLLEASTRDALSDLLALVAQDSTWRVILTCREYSSELVKSCFLQRSGLTHADVEMPPLRDAELDEVASACPALALPLKSAHLRRLFRNPYVLDKALRINWADGRPLPESEREFRGRFWSDVVRVDHQAAAGMPRRREEAFGQVALRRARALALYAPCQDLDPAVLDGLRRDSLIVGPPKRDVLAAPAHDVLEDWAILRWIDEQHCVLDGQESKFASALGSYPAIRRLFRKWVGELVALDPKSADALLQGAIGNASLPTHFRDDLLLALLQSAEAPAFLARNSSNLLADERRLLHRILHLLRIACLKTVSAPVGPADLMSLWRVPYGPAWPVVLGIVRNHLASFSEDERSALVTFVEEWARGVSADFPYPPGSQDAFAVTYGLLSQVTEYRERELGERLLRVIAKIPAADKTSFADVLRGDATANRRGILTAKMRKIVLGSIEGIPACRDVPEAVIAAARDEFQEVGEEANDEYWYSSHRELETVFGLREHSEVEFFPASAYRGPFLPLLRHHYVEGLGFLLSLLNHCMEWYAHPAEGGGVIEPPVEIELTFPDGKKRSQWANERLWGLYRGFSVGPYVLQCALMALEEWLLGVGKNQPNVLDPLLLMILRQSNSVSPTAVVASVSTAFPQHGTETLLVLLRSQACVRLDRHRVARESGLSGSKFLRQTPEHSFFQQERIRSDQLPHRRRDLESAIAMLQLGPAAPRVQDLLDAHLAALPALQDQTEEDHLWRLALHRMDLRKYRIGVEPSEGGGTEAAPKNQVVLTLTEPPPDLQQIVRASLSETAATTSRIGLLMWAQKAFERDGSKGHDPGQWQRHLESARSGATEPPEGAYDFGRGASGFMAAVCVRDHWEDMSADEQKWCLATICAELDRGADSRDHLARVQRGAMDGDRACAWAVFSLLGKKLAPEEHARVMRAAAIAITHAIDEVRSYAAAGAAETLWSIDRELALRCVDLLKVEASLVRKAHDAESVKPYPDQKRLEEVEAEVATIVRARFLEPGPLGDADIRAFDPGESIGATASLRILKILGGAPEEPSAAEAYRVVAETLVGWWDARENRESRARSNYKAEWELRDLLTDFLMMAAPESYAVAAVEPMLQAVDRHPRETQWVVRGLVEREDRRPNTLRFWTLWGLFADRVRSASWLKNIDNEYSRGTEMMSAVLLATGWKEDARHWRSLEGHAEKVHALFEALPPSAAALEDYVRFLYAIGERSLPSSFVRVADKLRAGDASHMLTPRNTAFLLERLLESHVYVRPLELKSERRLKAAILELLEMLVDRGSSAAFSMRDDFVTPLQVN